MPTSTSPRTTAPAWTCTPCTTQWGCLPPATRMLSPMTLARTTRRLFAWMLMASVLFSLVACGVHHGQMSALQPSEMSGNLGAGEPAPVTHASEGHESAASMALPLSCSLCSCFALIPAIDSRALATDYVPGRAAAPVVVRSLAQPPPRFLWPPLNPRASPTLLTL
ncbi:hypothetical protein D3C77_15410 [compost metagenome]